MTGSESEGRTKEEDEGDRMTCEAPRPRWRAGLFRPLNASLWISGILCAVAGVFLTNGIAGLLPPAGAALVLLGTSNGAVSALNLGSVLRLPDGRRTRVESLTRECEVLMPNLETIAQVLCADAEAVRRTVGLTITKVAREWTSGRSELFALFLLCSTIKVARDQDSIFGDGSACDPERERRLMLALHNLCGVLVADVAKMLDRDVAMVRDALVVDHGGPA